MRIANTEREGFECVRRVDDGQETLEVDVGHVGELDDGGVVR